MKFSIRILLNIANNIFVYNNNMLRGEERAKNSNITLYELATISKFSGSMVAVRSIELNIVLTLKIRFKVIANR